jgi:hypothetical protein
MTGTPISDVHAMLEKIGRERHARRLNRVANHPEVRPHIGGPGEAEADFSWLLRDPKNVLLMGQHGGMFFACISPGIYDAHILVVPEGRGPWAKVMTQACFHWMFTRTDAMEIIARCPAGNLRSHAMARVMGMTPRFRTPPVVSQAGRDVPCTVYSQTLQDWIDRAPGLEARGQAVRAQIESQGVTLTGKPDAEAFRQVGAAFEMFLNGQLFKGVLCQRRWAHMAGYDPADVISENPMGILFPGGTVFFQGNGNFRLVKGSRPSLM